jgi:hypothetical protein
MTNKTLDWRRAIQRAPDDVLEPLTRFVLLNLSVYMSDGGKCFPTTKQQAQDTNMTEKTVCKHLALAVAAGFLKKSQSRFKGKAWAHHEYEAVIPEGAVPPAVPEPEGTVPPAAPEPEGTVSDGSKALYPVQSNSPRELPKEEEPPDGGDAIAFDGYVIRLKAGAYAAKQKQFGLTEDEFADWLESRDDWLRTLPKSDRRVRKWWIPTWKALEQEAGALREERRVG